MPVHRHVIPNQPDAFMLQKALAFALVVSGAALVPAADPVPFAIPPRVVDLNMPNSTLGKVAAAVSRQTSIPVSFPPAAAGETCDGIYSGKPYWEVLEAMADQTGNRIALQDDGRRVALVPRGKSREVSSIHGAFRTVARQVVGRYLLDDGLTFHEVHLDIHWEPRFPVFRIDSQPAIAKAEDDRGTALVASSASARTQIRAAAVHAAVVRLNGIPREARKIAVLQGQFRVTASEKMLAFKFGDLTAKTPVAAPAQEKVEAVLKGFTKDEDTWEVEIELTYPDTIPEFESFETWATGNRLRLISPDGKASFEPASYAVNALGRKVAATYYFKEDAAKGLANPKAKGWSLVYEAPSTPLDLTVPFELKDVPLP
jgi:hypothetical protein